MQIPARPHYHLQIAVSGFLDERGMTYDFGDIKAIYKNYLEPHRIIAISMKPCPI